MMAMGGLLASLVRQPATQASLLASRLAQCSVLTQSSSSSAALSRLQSFHTSRSVHDEDDTKVPQTSPLQTPLAPAQPEPSTSAERPRATSRPSADHRNWEWYDYKDEVEWLRDARKPKYPDVGHVKAFDVEQSVKKITRVLKMIRRLSYSEAMYQLQQVPLKGARITAKAMTKARENAVEKGLDPERLVIDVAYATKGTVTKSIDYMSKKNFGILHHRRAHLHIKLREAPPEGYRGWKARLTVPFQLGAPRAKRRGFDRVGQV